ncbi:hypothetical protein RIF29_37839 [Crotalaria pallida]|uniref:Uncharacterized protein n=1 Tax=Crotalaria pallida TaxID=3830 RepID=A0AAN9E3L4_CROPI
MKPWSRRLPRLRELSPLPEFCSVKKAKGDAAEEIYFRKAFWVSTGCKGKETPFSSIYHSVIPFPVLTGHTCCPLVTCLALFLLIGTIIAILPGIEKDNLNTIAFSSLIVSVVSLIIAELGRRQSRPSLLRFYAVVSSVAMLLFIASLAKQYSLLKVFVAIMSYQYFKFRFLHSNNL